MPYTFDSLPPILKEFATNVANKDIANIKNTWNSSLVVNRWFTGQTIEIKNNEMERITPEDLIDIFQGLINTRKEELVKLFCANNEALITALKELNEKTLSTLLLKLLSITRKRVTEFLFCFVKKLIASLDEKQGKDLLNSMLNVVQKQPKCAFQKDKEERIEQLLREENYDSLPSKSAIDELRPIDEFKYALQISYTSKTSYSVMRKLWEEKPVIKSWFAGNPLEIVQDGERKLIRIDETDLYNVYLQLLKAKTYSMLELFWENNPALAEIIKSIALNENKRQDFITSLLGSDMRGISHHIYSVLKLFPHELLQELKKQKEKLPHNTPYKKNQIKVINLVLQGLPYKSLQSKKKKTSDPFLKKFEEFCEDLSQKKIDKVEQKLEDDPSINQWFLGQAVFDNKTEQQRTIATAELIDFFYSVLRTRNASLFERLILENMRLIAIISQLDSSTILPIIISILNMKSTLCVKKFFLALIENTPDVRLHLEKHKETLEEECRKDGKATLKQKKLSLLLAVLGNVHSNTDKDIPAKRVTKRISQRPQRMTRSKRQCTEEELLSDDDNRRFLEPRGTYHAIFSGKTLRICRTEFKKSDNVAPSHHLSARFFSNKLIISGIKPLESSLDKQDNPETLESMEQEKQTFSNKEYYATFSENKLRISRKEPTLTASSEIFHSECPHNDTPQSPCRYASEFFNNKVLSPSASKSGNHPEFSLQKDTSTATKPWHEELDEKESLYYLDFF